MMVHRLRSVDEFVAFRRREASALAAHQAEIEALVPRRERAFKVDGFSYTAGRVVSFEVDFKYSWAAGVVNWRERVCCPVTGFNNRMRGTIHLFDLEMDTYPDAQIYVTEQVSSFYRYMTARFPHAVGSEYIGDRVPLGTADARGIRNEDLTRLTFSEDCFDAVVSLDVFEHIPDFLAAFRQCARVLRPGGRMFWSVPFIASNHANLIRAVVRDGCVEHLQPPEYHADPLSSDGVLCYQHFGWEMLEQVKRCGFRDAYALCYFSRAFGYLGGEQFLFVARK